MPENKDQLAERIAALLSEREPGSSSILLESLERINQRLDVIENQLALQNHKSQITNLKSLHPSQEKFDVSEIVGELIIGDLDKPCPYEPTGKVCDHCSMCNSLGF